MKVYEKPSVRFLDENFANCVACAFYVLLLLSIYSA